MGNARNRQAASGCNRDVASVTESRHMHKYRCSPTVNMLACESIRDSFHTLNQVLKLRPSNVAQVRSDDGRAAVQRFCLSGIQTSIMLRCRTYDRLWKEAMEGIVAVSRAEDPQNNSIQKVNGQLTPRR